MHLLSLDYEHQVNLDDKPTGPRPLSNPCAAGAVVAPQLHARVRLGKVGLGTQAAGHGLDTG